MSKHHAFLLFCIAITSQMNAIWPFGNNATEEPSKIESYCESLFTRNTQQCFLLRKLFLCAQSNEVTETAFNEALKNYKNNINKEENLKIILNYKKCMGKNFDEKISAYSNETKLSILSFLADYAQMPQEEQPKEIQKVMDKLEQLDKQRIAAAESVKKSDTTKN